MPRKNPILSINDINENKLCYLLSKHYDQHGNRDAHRRMQMILRKALDGSLTELQRTCLTRYYAGIPQKLIAQQLGLSNSTVCRHIKAAEKKLRRIADYYS
ncbi:MAG: sigma-70 family RNA polymerase sigma factor [Ruminococcus sp.]|nr:sigma-70 family RNA polymerase sigma factor [Ruminococcus sp.]